MTKERQRTLSILLIEDMTVDADLIALELQRNGFTFDIHVVRTEKEIREFVRTTTPDVVLSDYSLPELSGPFVLQLCKQLLPTTPFVFVSGVIGEDVAVDMLRSGADDYVFKHRMGKLGPALQRVLDSTTQRVELEQAQSELLHAADIQRTLLQVVPDTMMVFDSEYCLREYYHGQDVSSALYFGRLIGLRLQDCTGEQSNVCTELLSVLQTMKDEHLMHASMSHTIGNADNPEEALFFEFRIAHNLRQDSWVVIVRDVTLSERQRVELEESAQRLQQADALKSNLLANLSHEIRTPMNGIIGVSSLLAESAATSENRELSEMLKSSSERLMHGLANVLCLAELESGSYVSSQQPFLVDDIVSGVKDRHVLSLLKDTVELEIADNSNGCSIHGDFASILTICRNLLSNSCKFTHKGSISMSFSVETTDNNSCLRIQQTDSGIGIDTSFIDTAFEYFTQAKSGLNRPYEGAGLGLAVVKKLVDLIGGDLSVESERGVGTSFDILLPVSIDKQAKYRKNTYFESDSKRVSDDRTTVVIHTTTDQTFDDIIDQIDSQSNLKYTHSFKELNKCIRDVDNVVVVLPQNEAAGVLLRIEKSIEDIKRVPSIIVLGEHEFTCYNHAPVTGSIVESGIHKYKLEEFGSFLTQNRGMYSKESFR